MKSLIFVILCAILICFHTFSFAAFNADDSSGMALPGIAIGGASGDPDYDMCPGGVKTIEQFLASWQRNNFENMYALLNDESMAKYSLEQALFDFRFLEYKPYQISSIKKVGDNYEFILAYGTWSGGDKDVIKFTIDGRSYLIIKPSGNSPFKRSAESYF